MASFQLFWFQIHYSNKSAFIHAKECGQIAEITLEYKEKHSILPDELISEDLW